MLGVDDGAFPPGKRKGTVLLTVVLLSNNVLQEVALSRVSIDGLDAVDTLTELVQRLERKPEVIVLPAIPCAGFNMLDPEALYRRLRIPIIVANPERPSEEAVEGALRKHFKDWSVRLQILKKMGPPVPIEVHQKRMFVQIVGVSIEDARKVLKEALVTGLKPEPLRVAKLVAKGLTPLGWT